MSIELGINARDPAYSDFDITFRRNPVTNSVSIKREEEAVKQSVMNILSTNRGERPFMPDFGSDIRAYLFENFDPITAGLIKDEIEVALTNYEPRIRILDIELNDLPNQNALRILLEFEIISPIQTTSSVEFTVERLR